MSWFKGPGLAAAAVVAASLAMTVAAGANVKHEGKWPDGDKGVSLDVTDVPRSDALKRLADAAGWNLVVKGPVGDPVSVHVKQMPASKVLDVLLDDGEWEARRDGTLVSVQPYDSEESSSAGVPPLPPIPPVPPVPPVAVSPPTPQQPAAGTVTIQVDTDDKDGDTPRARAQDRTVMGGNVTIAKGEVAREVTVFGGNVDIEGETTGDVTVFGGNVHVHDHARVRGDASVFGGTLTLDRNAKVDGDVNALGGTLRRDPAAHVGGDVNVKGGDGDDDESSGHGHHASWFARTGEAAMNGLRLAAVLFVIGTVLIALGGRRVEALRAEVASRPMRSIAMGVLGTFGAVVLTVALCVTIIGIPIAIIGVMVASLAVLGAMCAVLSVVGEGLLRHKTENPYVHLALGCGLFVVLAAIPWFGTVMVVVTVLAAIGVLVATRGAGMLQRRSGGSPYRTAAQPL